MQYSKLIWKHCEYDLPVEILSEYDSVGWETRKVEVFADGSLGFAGPQSYSGSTRLSLIQRPADADVVNDNEYRIEPLSAADFERGWKAAVSKSNAATVPVA